MSNASPEEVQTILPGIDPLIIMKPEKRLLRITTVPISLRLLLHGQLRYFRERGFDVLAVSAADSQLKDGAIDGTPHKVVNMTRQITPFKDLLSLLQLIRVMRAFRPDIVHTHTPKAGLLGMLSAWICRVPVRMHTVAGLPLMEKHGLLKKILIMIERITYSCATGVYPNSLGLRNYIQNNIGSGYRLKIIGKGSSNGIDTGFFRRTPALEEQASAIREKYGIGKETVVFSFVGRVVRDKGISELITAYQKFRHSSPQINSFLMIVGPLEQDLDPLSDADLQFLKEDKQVIVAGYQTDVRPWIMASDVFVFPSYREGFPNVVMQACCLQVPCIVSNINGCNEIIEHGRTGLIVQPKDAYALFNAMHELAANEEKRADFGVLSRERVVRDFDQQYIWRELEAEYEKNLREASQRSASRSIYNVVFKPALDRLVAFLVLVVLSPIFLVCVVLLAKANQGKVWFTQSRPGKNGKLFRVVKFKTMNDARDSSGELLPDADRLHATGRFIRKTSLDELPQLLNVLKGDMSIVGPRPLLPEYLPLYNDEQSQRHLVKPGITGWAQVNGRNAISWEQKFEYDVWYVKHQSFWLDLKILFLTVVKVFKAEGISSATSVTMEKFKGTPNR